MEETDDAMDANLKKALKLIEDVRAKWSDVRAERSSAEGRVREIEAGAAAMREALVVTLANIENEIGSREHTGRKTNQWPDVVNGINAALAPGAGSSFLARQATELRAKDDELRAAEEALSVAHAERARFKYEAETNKRIGIETSDSLRAALAKAEEEVAQLRNTRDGWKRMHDEHLSGLGMVRADLYKLACDQRDAHYTALCKAEEENKNLSEQIRDNRALDARNEATLGSLTRAEEENARLREALKNANDRIALDDTALVERARYKAALGCAIATLREIENRLRSSAIGSMPEMLIASATALVSQKLAEFKVDPTCAKAAKYVTELEKLYEMLKRMGKCSMCGTNAIGKNTKTCSACDAFATVTAIKDAK